MTTVAQFPQVLIVGAGPVGLTLAIELTRYGVPVRIIDKAAARTDRSKALVLWSRTLELLERGPGSSDFIKAGFQVTAVNLISGQEKVGQVDMSKIDSPYPYALMIPQCETERILEESLRKLGVTVERNVELTALSRRPTSVEVTLRLVDGTQEQTSTPWLAGCDGAHSAVRHAVGATFDGETLNSDWMLADIHMRGYPSADTEASIYWHKEGAFVVFPISPGRFRILADLPPSGSEHPAVPSLEQVQAIMDRRGPQGLQAFDPIWLAGFRINGRKVSEYRWGRAFLLGDAAHVHSPAGGQGMNTGMQDAFNLAWKLALAIEHRGFEALLDSYNVERTAVGDKVLKAAGTLTTVGTLRNPLAQKLRDVVGHAILGIAVLQQSVADTMSEISIGYPQSPLNGVAHAGSGPKVGGRIRPRPGEAPIGAGIRSRFVVMAWPSEEISALTERFATLVDPELRTPFDRDGIWLSRPDGYLACSSNKVSDVQEYLLQVSANE